MAFSSSGPLRIESPANASVARQAPKQRRANLFVAGDTAESDDATAQDELIANLRAHIRHVFVIYQENRSFDSYFGTFPGADNLATAEARHHGFRQYDPLGHVWVTPFALKAADVASPNHSRVGLLKKSDHGRMDQFIAEEERIETDKRESQSYSRQMGLLTMAHEDCDTIPFLWLYAHRFALYDHIFEGMYGPSTPGNIDLIAAQTGQTQWARSPGQAVQPNDQGPGEPVVNSIDPPFGPYAHGLPRLRQLDQTYATLLLTLLGRNAIEAKLDNAGVKQDVNLLGKLHHQAVPWAWYQEGFGDGQGNVHPAYIPHHNSPQYFGYVRKNQALWSGVHDLTDFFTVMTQHRLPSSSVVFIKGGHLNLFGWKPANPDSRVQAHFLGDDDHPGNSDSQIAESLAAKVINTVARSSYWQDSAIIIIWDDPGGFYDHVPPPRFERCPDRHPCGDGPRIPLILISPYAKMGAIVSDAGDHASFAKFLDVLFQLPSLASLPDEKPYLPEGPRDANPRLTNLLGGFDPARLAGKIPPIPAAEAEISDTIVKTFPPAMSCSTLGLTPISIPGASLAPPTGFDPLPQKRRSH
ncbi:MAG TPA: alkaline phosphatase family protein [Candidatus Acidoferrales bacterium]|nr:alkaline phosphatase family protein [Candidatus Acidoferrales bacterium]